jgi:diguanylate cyclase (GGDEF)-like protein
VLTRLPNRRLLMDRLQTALAFSARTQHWGAVLFLDMDRFKTINDTLGHDHGDLLLLEVARRIQSCLRDADTVARVGGDEFVIVLDELDVDTDAAVQKAAQVAEKIRLSLSQPYQLNAHERYSSPSIGVCMYLGAQVAAPDLIKNADVAMYQAKADGRNLVRFFDVSMQRTVEARAQLDADLRNCVLEQQLRLFYQIQVDQQHRPLGAEALVRWFHPRRGMVPPAHFIGIAEESNLIIDIGNWVLDTACKQLQLWSGDAHTRALTLAVNVSAQQFKQPQFVDLVTSALDRHNVNHKRLKLELTESVILSDVAATIEKMQILKGLSVALSLDDFGTGYSSLSYLKQLPLDQIKIDQSFVRDLETDASDAVMVRTIIDLAKNFNLNVIAEGVETLAQLNFLKENGCPAFQGYYFSKPVPIEEFEKLLLQSEVMSVPSID